MNLIESCGILQTFFHYPPRNNPNLLGKSDRKMIKILTYS